MISNEYLQSLVAQMRLKGYYGYLAVTNSDDEVTTVYFSKEQGHFNDLSKVKINDDVVIYTIQNDVVQSVTSGSDLTVGTSEYICYSNAQSDNDITFANVMSKNDLIFGVGVILCVILLCTAFFKLLKG